MSDNSFQGAPAGADAAGATAPESGATATPEDVNTGSSQGEGSEESQEPKTFTQEEVDRIAQKEREKAERKVRRELAQAAEQPQRPTIGEPPVPEDFDSPVAYAEALADHKLAVKLAEHQEQTERTTVKNTYLDRAEAVREKYEDFEAVAHRDDLPITPAMTEVILASEVGPEMAYFLGKNPGEAERIARLPALQQAVELGKIEATLSTNPTPAPVKKVPSAPEPITPVGSRTSSPSYDPSDPRSVKMPIKDWMKARNEQVAKQHR